MKSPEKSLDRIHYIFGHQAHTQDKQDCIASCAQTLSNATPPTGKIRKYNFHNF